MQVGKLRLSMAKDMTTFILKLPSDKVGHGIDSFCRVPEAHVSLSFTFSLSDFSLPSLLSLSSFIFLLFFFHYIYRRTSEILQDWSQATVLNRVIIFLLVEGLAFNL